MANRHTEGAWCLRIQALLGFQGTGPFPEAEPSKEKAWQSCATKRAMSAGAGRGTLRGCTGSSRMVAAKIKLAALT